MRINNKVTVYMGAKHTKTHTKTKYHGQLLVQIQEQHSYSNSRLYILIEHTIHTLYTMMGLTVTFDKVARDVTKKG